LLGEEPLPVLLLFLGLLPNGNSTFPEAAERFSLEALRHGFQQKTEWVLNGGEASGQLTLEVDEMRDLFLGGIGLAFPAVLNECSEGVVVGSWSVLASNLYKERNIGRRRIPCSIPYIS
jgi:hypothetical protein